MVSTLALGQLHSCQTQTASSSFFIIRPQLCFHQLTDLMLGAEKVAYILQCSAVHYTLSTLIRTHSSVERGCVEPLHISFYTTFGKTGQSSSFKAVSASDFHGFLLAPLPHPQQNIPEIILSVFALSYKLTEFNIHISSDVWRGPVMSKFNHPQKRKTKLDVGEMALFGGEAWFSHSLVSSPRSSSLRPFPPGLRSASVHPPSRSSGSGTHYSRNLQQRPASTLACPQWQERERHWFRDNRQILNLSHWEAGGR